jgi:hypothetical protein
MNTNTPSTSLLTTSCVPWKGAITGDGYGTVKQNGKSVYAHRLAWFRKHGTWPGPLDHTCHNTDTSCPGGKGCRHRRCINLAHLEEVTSRQNTLRSSHTIPAQNAIKTQCPSGHPYDSENTYARKGKRHCRICNKLSNRLRNATNRRAKIGLAHDVIALKNVPGFVPGNLHGYAFRDPGTDQVANSRAA